RDGEHHSCAATHPPTLGFAQTVAPALYTLSLHDALPISDTLTAEELLGLDNPTLLHRLYHQENVRLFDEQPLQFRCSCSRERSRSEEHTSELRSRENLVCRLLLEKKNAEAQAKGQGGNRV